MHGTPEALAWRKMFVLFEFQRPLSEGAAKTSVRQDFRVRELAVLRASVALLCAAASRMSLRLQLFGSKVNAREHQESVGECRRPGNHELVKKHITRDAEGLDPTTGGAIPFRRRHGMESA